jgi:hypothetical protein
MQKTNAWPRLICPLCYRPWMQCESMRVAQTVSVSEPPCDGMSRSVILAARHHDVCLRCRHPLHLEANELAAAPQCVERLPEKRSVLPSWWDPRDYDRWLAIRRAGRTV